MAYHAVTSKEDFVNKLNEAGGKLVVVDFYATWCGPCQSSAPYFEQLARETPSAIFLKVDIDELEDLSSDYNIEAMPTFMFIKNKEKLDEFSGRNDEQLKELLDKYK